MEDLIQMGPVEEERWERVDREAAPRDPAARPPIAPVNPVPSDRYAVTSAAAYDPRPERVIWFLASAR